MKSPAGARTLILCVLSALVLGLYWPVSHYGFIQVDDTEYVTRNPTVQRGLTADGIRSAIHPLDGVNWHPVTWLSHMADVSLFGMDPGPQHRVNLFLHLCGTLLLFHALCRMTGKVWESGLVAALFAVHPMHVESVAWISERKDVLSGFFWMASLWAYARYAERPGFSRYLSVAVLFSLGLMSKSMVVTLPFVLLLLDYWPLGRVAGFGTASGEEGPRFPPAAPGRLILEKFPLLALSAAASVVAYFTQAAGGAVGSLERFPLGIRIGNALGAYLDYVLKLSWPSGLSVFYPHPGHSLSLAKVACGGLFLLGATALALRQLRRRPWLAVGWFWFLGTLVPVIGLVQVGQQAMADRYSYLPSIGLFVALAWTGGEWAARWKAPTVAGVAAALGLAALSAVTWVQVGYWRGPVPLFTRALQVTDDNFFAHTVLGAAAFEAGNDNEALFHVGEALRIRPDNPDAHENLGLLLARGGRPDAAAAQFREVLRVRPGDARVRLSLAAALADSGRADEALAQVGEAVRVGGLDAGENKRAGLLLASLGRLEEAVERFREVLRLNPGDPDALYDIGIAYVKLGQDREALAPLERAAAANAGDVSAHSALAALYYRQGRVSDSAREYETVLRLAPSDSGARRRLQAIRRVRGD